MFFNDTRRNDNEFVDDLPYAKLVAKHLEVPLDIVTIDSHNLANDIEKMVYQLDEPLADPAALNVFISVNWQDNKVLKFCFLGWVQMTCLLDIADICTSNENIGVGCQKVCVKA